MAYGVNAAFGLKPISSITGGTWTEKTNEYYIYASTDGATTYNTSIFTGDPVVFTPTAANITGNPNIGGFITRYLPNFADGTPSTFSALPLLGVFMGCEYTASTGVFTKAPYWPASTQVLKGTYIKAFVIDDPNVVYNIQISSSINAAANAFVAPPVFPNTNTNNNLYKGAIGSNFALNIGGGTNFDTVVNAYTTATGQKYANNEDSGSVRTGQSAFYLDVCTSTALNNDHDYDKTTATLPLKVVGWTQDPKNIAAPGLTQATTPFLNVRVVINNHVYGHNVAGTTLG